MEEDEPLWTIYRSGKRVTIATFLTAESAERQLERWRDREARGIRPDITTKDAYVGRL